jgi:RNA polymerase primary sigma factor
MGIHRGGNPIGAHGCDWCAEYRCGVASDDAVNEALGHLSERDQDILRLRLGLDHGKVRTCSEIDEKYGVTGARIRQLESKALVKLRRLDAAHLLGEYLQES